MGRWNRYDGSFDLAFLRPNEKVRAGAKQGDCEIINASERVVAVLPVGSLYQRNRDGTITVVSERP